MSAVVINGELAGVGETDDRPELERRVIVRSWRASSQIIGRYEVPVAVGGLGKKLDRKKQVQIFPGQQPLLLGNNLDTFYVVVGALHPSRGTSEIKNSRILLLETKTGIENLMRTWRNRGIMLGEGGWRWDRFGKGNWEGCWGDLIASTVKSRESPTPKRPISCLPNGRTRSLAVRVPNGGTGEPEASRRRWFAGCLARAARRRVLHCCHCRCSAVAAAPLKTLSAGKLTERVLKLFMSTGNEEIVSFVESLNIKQILIPVLPTSMRLATDHPHNI
ncbi:hypothetical protein KFK09_011069 [Dendrobium nobile]|uniref:Uncharacterized protein n=1 Tax=Dendrobium nobile TaxID=94219 RepID=A0A8T3BDV4_DENNO|nr:hypothetical protein KFK09_011069 [Dendrobium nobile]